VRATSGGHFVRDWPVAFRLRRRVVLVIAMASMWGRLAQGEDLLVPARVQAQLVGKVVIFDRNFKSHIADKVNIAIITKSSNADTERAAARIQTAFHELGPIAGYPHEEFVVPWTDARALAAICAERKVVIVYLTPGLGTEVEHVARVLVGTGVLSVAGTLSYVERGTVLGFDLVSGQPKLVINLPSSKRQGILFQAGLLKLARVIE
jgi:YfiR/HmsC-like